MTNITPLRQAFPRPGSDRRLPDATGFLARHGRGLSALAEAIDDPWLVTETRTACLAPPTDIGNLDAVGRLREIQEMLDGVTASRLMQSASRYAGPDIGAAHRWYGARLQDLLR
ncbi:hypothetical protein U5903_03385 [Cereibacter johrii]|uniref:hypothetical protein n=1 Tax=Cereibacter johrii TaxID=445629 RepID=UPI002B25F33B|nr:hypothetical protein [Cereibacter johrii]MEA5159809.1 hypothetical protein [Cereibacter johrii]